MILWLASYPKSGNTLVKSILSAYFFSNDGKFDFKLLNNIKQFPDLNLFKNLGINVSDQNDIIKNYIYAQEVINKRDKNSIRFLKSHQVLNAINGYQFTNYKNSLGVIYIVRDPRKVVLSNANHNQITIEESFNQMCKNILLGGKGNFRGEVETYAGSWSSNYNSWKEFKKFNKYLLIKYEDLVQKPYDTFKVMFNFINKISKTQIEIDKIKLENVLKTTNFEYLQNLEDQQGFPEAAKDDQGKNIQFFKYGKSNSGNKIPKLIKAKIEKNFSLEMNELGYL